MYKMEELGIYLQHNRGCFLYVILIHKNIMWVLSCAGQIDGQVKGPM